VVVVEQLAETDRPESAPQHALPLHDVVPLHDSEAPLHVAPASMQAEAAPAQHVCPAEHVVVPHVRPPPLLVPPLDAPLLAPDDAPLLLPPPPPAGLLEEPPHATARDTATEAAKSEMA
jgi:hypothetical protein